ncbi:phosphonate metabolism protein/1,5-bisphosphokinase (PRPP-forming) PhnN [Gordonia alkanivorans]|uniref:Ribose 1,5-bisphosphate phosphokinase PhnN n=1 Tax=Gordonia alkanivorans CGMCC 6845 TaxID=1423140 RepID=W9DDS4_9ACTN|nr:MULTISPECIES: phosphonate metabolism protein/1,5-bisphosphokinase (PRPP-forming) PhnN [Gordonia]ETA06597.1 ribonucleoside-triphosphate reductase [Gordonia alkanivorans CGMCC 6845]MDH3016882.1 phosphonate metabolism protein/1,5-bisphosphokinase (PRPP-forming) PhnN [Gordonia alkanivorans]MDH3042127.1 phosphonate metabolism protein/1,5-bisphosphokinase (PRPP-forming) PhnN [Gordonia alkanivorans]QGP87873.1 phosphonate metabolism protein/1,5-bisphosphokinase (PRPP-forming) PhnN [Gordonia sp. 135]
MSTPLGPGTFVAVVGASGAGKDSLMAYAAEHSDAHFPRRVITRPAGPGEDHLPVSEIEFDSACARGEFAVHWGAHGLRYGIPVEIDDMVTSGRPVVVNVSRSVLDELAQRYERLVVVRVEVSDAVRLRRLQARGRESTDDVAARLRRPDPAPHRAGDVVIVNHGTVAEGGAQLIRAIGPLTTVTTRSDEPRSSATRPPSPDVGAGFSTRTG